MDYLQQDEIGGIIAKGLAALYLDKPQFPIDYLAKWLLQYSRNISQQQNRIEQTNVKQQLKDQEKTRLQQIEVMNSQWQEIAQQMQDKHDKFLTELKETPFHDEFLENIFCDYISNKYKVNVYVAELDFPPKEVNFELEDDENAHFNPEGTKLLSYIYASKGQEFLIGIQLQPETGVTYDVLKEPQPDENGEIIQTNGLYIANVVKEPRMVYHKWPKLGSFYAIPLVYNTVQFEAAYDAGIESRQAYLVAKENQDKEKAMKEQEFEERMESEDQIVIEQERQAYLAGLEPIQETPLQNQKKEFILCIDTLDQDREISQNDRDEVYNLAQLLIKSWEMQEIIALQQDIDKQIAYVQNQQTPYKEMIEQFQLEEESYIEGQQERLSEVKEKEKIYQYEVECLKLEKIREKFQDKEFFQPLLNLNENRFIKYSNVIQAALYLIEFDKAEINIKGTNRLNWRKISKLWNEDLLQQIISYNHRGPKPKPKYEWSMVDRVQKRVEKIDQDAVDAYNIVLGRLLKFLVLACRLRKIDIEIRRENIADKRKEIQDLKEEIEKNKQLKETTLAETLEQMTPEEKEEFNQEEWEVDFDNSHPNPELPEYPQDEIDDDYLFEQQQQ